MVAVAAKTAVSLLPSEGIQEALGELVVVFPASGVADDYPDHVSARLATHQQDVIGDVTIPLDLALSDIRDTESVGDRRLVEPQSANKGIVVVSLP